MASHTPRLVLITLATFLCPLGTFIADFNETHVKNPNWPPHARFHNGQTMSSSIALTMAAWWCVWQIPGLKTEEARRLAWGAGFAFASIYYISGLTGVLYPGALGVDPEFFTEFTESCGHFPQKYIFGGLITVTWLSFGLEWGRLGDGLEVPEDTKKEL